MSEGTWDGQPPVRAAGRRGRCGRSDAYVADAVLPDQQSQRFLRVVLGDFPHHRAVREIAVEQAKGAGHQ
ncbi:hypothetical protein GCM10010421_09910 [Streptomyces glaucus]|uniref:Uncharacterized protein n=1 Tax=Streptomyces glaucus TaxID=284029 RepID=A0ABN3JBH4_9ACTN